jgi:divalent metal cation (Fe/Co/Zn/Cd) transporter
MPARLGEGGVSTELPTLTVVDVARPARIERDAGWLRAARAARWLSWFSLVWMMAEGVVGLIAGYEAGSIGVVSWAIGSAVEGAAAIIVIVRLTGRNRFSETAEHRARKWVAGSFFVLVPYILFEAVSKLISGDAPERSTLALALVGSSVVLMPLLGWAKLRLGRRLDSGATAGEGVQNLLCAAQGVVAIVGMLLGAAGAAWLDPVAAIVIAAIAAKEGLELWRGEDCDCHAMPGFETAGDGCADDGCECC